MSFNWWDRLPRWAQAVLTWLGSWGTEMLGGLALSLLLCLGAKLVGFSEAAQLGGATLVGMVISVLYENFVDSNGWDPVDVGQRACGQVLGLIVWALL